MIVHPRERGFDGEHDDVAFSSPSLGPPNFILFKNRQVDDRHGQGSMRTKVAQIWMSLRTHHLKYFVFLELCIYFEDALPCGRLRVCVD